MSFAQIKSALVLAHRWIGVVLAPVFLLVILSGAVLAFKPIVADLAAPTAATAPVDPARLRVMVQGLEGKAAVSSITIVDQGHAIDVASPDATVAGRWDLASGARTAPAASGLDVFQIAERLHKQLFVGLGLVVEIATWAMLAIMIVGPFLAWLRFRKTVIGWHLALGWLALPLTILAPLTGVLMTLHVGQTSTPLPRAAHPVTISQALAIAAPNTDVGALVSARGFRGGTVMMQTRGTTPATVVVTDTRAVALTGGPGWVKEIHEGTWAGAWSGIVAVVQSLVLLALTVTGFWSWYARRRRDRAGAPADDADILVLHASQTGTATRLAQATVTALLAGGERAVVAPLGAVTAKDLAGHRLVLVVASTTGDGTLPDGALRFVKSLASGSLADVRFALLGLGDRTYAHFCAGPETLRAALIGAGAVEAMAMARADRDPDPTWTRWLDDLRARLGLACAAGVAPVSAPTVTLRLAERRRLDDPSAGETQETWAVTLVGEDDLDFRPGDLLRLAPTPGERERSYSIGSSARVDRRRIELTVKRHQWHDADGRSGFGVMSERLTHSLGIGEALAARIDAHPSFNPPNDPSWPILMIGAGSGVAPFPGFLAERRASGHAGPAWLIFGNRHRAGDFLWGERFEAARADGSLTRLDTAFSRDADDGVHVEARLEEAPQEVLDWLVERKAMIYVCGRRDLATGVRATLARILVDHGGFTLAAAEAEIEAWVAEERMRLDLFD